MLFWKYKLNVRINGKNLAGQTRLFWYVLGRFMPEKSTFKILQVNWTKEDPLQDMYLLLHEDLLVGCQSLKTLMFYILRGRIYSCFTCLQGHNLVKRFVG